MRVGRSRCITVHSHRWYQVAPAVPRWERLSGDACNRAHRGATPGQGVAPSNCEGALPGCIGAKAAQNGLSKGRAWNTCRVRIATSQAGSTSSSHRRRRRCRKRSLSRAFVAGAPENRAPAVELTVGPPVPGLRVAGPELRRPENDVPRIVADPNRDGACGRNRHAPVQLGPGIGRQDMERCRLHALLNCPLDRALEHIGADPGPCRRRSSR